MEERLLNQQSYHSKQHQFEYGRQINNVGPVLTRNKYEQNEIKKKESSPHYQALWATISLIVGIIIAIILYMAIRQPWVSFGISLACYLIYLFVGCVDNTLLIYFKDIDKQSDFNTFYNYMRYLPGIFIFTARCYHTQTVTRSRTVTDSDGNSKQESYTQTQDVVTHWATQQVLPYETEDESGQVNHINSDKNIIFVHFFMKHRFYDEQSSSKLQRLYHNFKINNTYDESQSFWMNYQVSNFIERKTFYVGNLDFNFYCWFIICTVLGLIWPYSLWVQSKISRFDVELKRAVKI